MFRYALSLNVALLFFGLAVLNGYGSELFPGVDCHSIFLERITSCDSVMVATWSSVQPADPPKDIKGKGQLTVVEVIKESKQKSEQIKVGKIIAKGEVPSDREGQRVLVVGYVPRNGERCRYVVSPVILSDAAIDFLRAIPSVDAKPAVQFDYLARHLESNDPIVAKEAFWEFAKSVRYEDVAGMRDQLPADKLRQWVNDPQTSAVRLGMYGRLLGLLGSESDVPLLREISLRKVDGFRHEADGMFSGYLMLAGEKGLETLEDAKLRDKTVSFSETYATMQALRFMWTYGDGRISKDRLRQSMRIILDRPEMADLVIIDLGRWQDWAVSDRLMELYGTAGYDIPSTKRATVRFFLTAEATKPKDAAEPLPEHVVTAQKHLKTLREKDPETVKAAEEFFFLKLK